MVKTQNHLQKRQTEERLTREDKATEKWWKSVKRVDFDQKRQETNDSSDEKVKIGDDEKSESFEMKNQSNRSIWSKTDPRERIEFENDENKKTRPLESEAGERLIEKCECASVVDDRAASGGGQPNISKHTEIFFGPKNKSPWQQHMRTKVDAKM